MVDIAAAVAGDADHQDRRINPEIPLDLSDLYVCLTLLLNLMSFPHHPLRLIPLAVCADRAARLDHRERTGTSLWLPFHP